MRVALLLLASYLVYVRYSRRAFWQALSGNKLIAGNGVGARRSDDTQTFEVMVAHQIALPTIVR